MRSRKKDRYKLYDHPWMAAFVVVLSLVLAFIISIVIFSVLRFPSQIYYRVPLQLTIPYLLLIFFIYPCLYGLPSGWRGLRSYLAEIRLSTVKPLLLQVLIAVVCVGLWLLGFAVFSIILRLIEGLPFSAAFFSRVITFKGIFPPASQGWIMTIPSVFEEVIFRGVLLRIFLRKHSRRLSIVVTALIFGLLHLFNLIDAVELSFILSQVVMGIGLGIFYANLVLDADSLLPAMLFHYLGNFFIYSFSAYLQNSLSQPLGQILITLSSWVMVPLLVWAEKKLTKKIRREEIQAA